MDWSTEDYIGFYERKFYCFSNFSAFKVHWKATDWMTSEHAYQAAKFMGHHQKSVYDIFHSTSAHDCKQIAKKNVDKVRPDWDDVKLEIMEDILVHKLDQHEFIQKRLRETEDKIIVEDSHKDSFWGWGPDKKGQNHLGKIWMKLREEARSK